MEKTLKMELLLNTGKTTNLDIADPKEGLTKAEIMTLIDDIIAKKAIVVNGAFVQSLKAAYIQTVDTEAIA